jgi:hypothetical protein
MREVWVSSKEGGKGRSFRGLVFGHVEADGLWDGGQGAKDVYRPIYAALGASEEEAGPFLANMRLGYKASTAQPTNERKRDKWKDHDYEFMRSAGYVWRSQRHPGYGTIVQAYMPHLYRLDPGMVDPAGVRFAILPSLDWTAKHASDIDSGAMLVHLRATHPDIGAKLAPEGAAELTRLAALFLVYLDRRTRCPLVPDPLFAYQVLVSAIDKGYATRGKTEKTRGSSYEQADGWGRGRWGYVEEFIPALRLHPGIVVNVKHEELEPFLAAEVALYFATVGSKSAARARPGAGRKAPAQQVLFS